MTILTRFQYNSSCFMYLSLYLVGINLETLVNTNKMASSSLIFTLKLITKLCDCEMRWLCTTLCLLHHRLYKIFWICYWKCPNSFHYFILLALAAKIERCVTLHSSFRRLRIKGSSAPENVHSAPITFKNVAYHKTKSSAPPYIALLYNRIHETKNFI
jgi:hypothetical protein